MKIMNIHFLPIVISMNGKHSLITPYNERTSIMNTLITIYGEIGFQKTTELSGYCAFVETHVTEESKLYYFIQKYCFNFDAFGYVFDGPNDGTYYDPDFPELYESTLRYEYNDGSPEMYLTVDPYDYYTNNPFDLSMDEWTEELVVRLAKYLTKKTEETPTTRKTK